MASLDYVLFFDILGLQRVLAAWYHLCSTYLLMTQQITLPFKFSMDKILQGKFLSEYQICLGRDVVNYHRNNSTIDCLCMIPCFVPYLFLLILLHSVAGKT